MQKTKKIIILIIFCILFLLITETLLSSWQLKSEIKKGLSSVSQIKIAAKHQEWLAISSKSKEGANHFQKASKILSWRIWFTHLPFLNQERKISQKILNATAVSLNFWGDLTEKVFIDLKIKVPNLASLDENARKNLIIALQENSKWLKDNKATLNKTALALSSLPQSRINILSSYQNLAGNFLSSQKEITDLLVNFSPYLPKILGTEGEKTYLLLFQNHYEIEPTGGLISSYGILKVKNGAITNFESYDIGKLLNETSSAMEPARPVFLYIEEYWTFASANWWPDFKKSAEFTNFLWQKNNLPKIDGVIAISSPILEDLLKVLGPTEVPDYPYIFTDKNVMGVLEYEVRSGYKDRRAKEAKERKEVVARLAETIIKKTEQVPYARLIQFINTIFTSLQKKDLMFYSSDSQIEQALIDAHWAGTIKKKKGQDFLMSVDANLGSGKADAGMDVTMNLKINLQNLAKPEAEFKKNFAYILNLDNPQFAESLYVYRNYHRLYVPKGSFVYATFGGQNDAEGGLDFEKEQEMISAGTYLYLKKGDKGVLTYKYYLAPEITSELKKGRYSIYLQKQPGTSRPLSLKILLPKDWKNFNINFPHAEIKENVITINTDLSTDREITIEKK